MTVFDVKARQAEREEREELALIRAVAPAARRNQEARRQLELRARRENARLARFGARLRVL